MEVENNKDGTIKEEQLEDEVEKETGEKVEIDTNKEGATVEKEEPKEEPKVESNAEIMVVLSDILKELKLLTNSQAGDIIDEVEEEVLTDELDELLG